MSWSGRARWSLVASMLAAAASAGALSSLESLKLWRNQIGDRGMRAVAAALATGAWPSLKSIYLDHNPASAEARQEVQLAAQARAVYCQVYTP